MHTDIVKKTDKLEQVETTLANVEEYLGQHILNFTS